MTAGQVNYREKARKELIGWEKSLREEYRDKCCDAMNISKEDKDAFEVMTALCNDILSREIFAISNRIDQSL